MKKKTIIGYIPNYNWKDFGKFSKTDNRNPFWEWTNLFVRKTNKDYDLFNYFCDIEPKIKTLKDYYKVKITVERIK